jgi:hypothetical protein
MSTETSSTASGTGRNTDLLGRTLTAEEQRLADLYEELKSLVGDSSELPPCALANLRGALASVAVTVADLGIAYEHLIDYGC